MKFVPVLMLIAVNAAAATFAVLPARRSALFTVPATFEIQAPPAKVWSLLTTAKGLGVLAGFTGRGADANRSLTKLGDHIEALAWDDTGRVVVTGFIPQRELRLAWEPNSATYFSSRRIVLTPSAEGTLVEYSVRYTDDRSEADENATRVFGGTLRAVTSFKALAEKK